MAIRLPDFENSYCENLSVCGFMNLPPRKVQESVLEGQDRSYMVVRYKTSQGDAFARAVVGVTQPQQGKHGKRRLHVHVDIALKSYFSAPPSTTHKRADLERLFRGLIGYDIVLYPRSDWGVPRSEIPKGRTYPWDTDIQTEVAGVGMELIGAEFHVTGSKIVYFHWKWSDLKRKRLSLTTNWVSREAKVERDYIVNELASEESYLRGSILGKPRQVRKKEQR